MESQNIRTDGGLIIWHSGRLTASGLSVYIQTLFESPGVDILDFAVTDFSRISAIDLDESEAAEIGALVHDLRSLRGTMDQTVRWAVVSADDRIESLARVMANYSAGYLHLKVFGNLDEALLWARNAGILRM